MLKRILHNSIVQSGINQVGSAVIAMITFMVLAQQMEKEAFGHWVLYLTLITFIDMVKAGFVQTALIKYASGATKENFLSIIGSSWIINIVFTAIIGIGFYLASIVMTTSQSGLHTFLKMYLVYGLCSMPFNYYLWVKQVKGQFNKITIARISNNLLFLLGTAFWAKNCSLMELVLLHASCLGSISTFIFFSRQSYISSLKYFSSQNIRKFIDFGKYHFLAFLGSNLLKSSDIFLIGWILGPQSVAIYSIPLRLIEIIEMPLKACIQVIFPKLSTLDNKKDLIGLKKYLESYLGFLSFIYIPFISILFFNSTFLVEFIGGEKYASADTIFQIFLIYGLFIPFDRLTGISMDAIGLPKLNFYKVLAMALVNIIGDILVLHFTKSLELVAVVTICNVICGMLVGFLLVKAKIGVSLKGILSNGTEMVITIFDLLTLKTKNYENQKS